LKAASEIRFKEIAHFVGLSLVRNPVHAHKVPKGVRPAEPLRDGDLPSIQQHARPEKLHSQLEWLKVEQRQEADQLRKLESSLSDAVLQEKKAKSRIEKQQELRDIHAHRATEVSRKINSLRDQLATAEAVPHKEPKVKSRELMSGGSLREDLSRGSQGVSTSASSFAGTGLLARSAAAVCADRTLSLGGHDTMGSSPASWTAGPDNGAEVSIREGVEAAYLAAWAPQDSHPGLPTAPLPHGGQRFGQSQSQPQLKRPPATPPAHGSRGLAHRRPDSSTDLTRPGTWTQEEEADMRHEGRLEIRLSLKELCGGSKEAFKKLDLNGSGYISCQEFADGVSRMGINWQQMTGMKRPRDLFNLFDEDKDAAISFAELFPEDVPDKDARPSTPDFLRAYNKNRNYSIKNACWQPANADEEMRTSQDFAQMSEEAAMKRKWMCSTMRRLKTRGKSDARCREVVALHLPRGTGPKDREGVSTFTQNDLKNTLKVYNDEVNLPMRRMWKVVGDYKDQRREQKRIYEKLFSVTEALTMRQKNEELAAGLGFGSLLGKSSGDGADAGGAGACTLKSHGVDDDDDVEDLRKDYLKFADTSEMLGKRGFTRLLQALLPSGQFTDRQGDGWWEEVLKRKVVDNAKKEETSKVSDVLDGMGDDLSKSFHESKKKSLSDKVETSLRSGDLGPRTRQPCTFEQFCMWWAEHQAKRS